MNNNTIVQAVGLSKVFRDFWERPKAKAVNDIDFTIKKGEIVGLLGPNGSGKSTTVKMILGLLYPTAGNITVFGQSPQAVETKKAIGYLPEESYLYKYLTAYETLDFFGSLFGLSKAERESRIEQLLDMVGMSHAKRRRVGEFSKGMARRIGLAQAMINDPEFLILDEPTSGLDPLGCKEVKDLILMLKKRGKTVLVTSHLLSDVEDVCDRVIILYGGKIRAQGSMDELLTKSDATQLTIPTLNDSEMKNLLAKLKEDINLNGDQVQVTHPRISLEDYFLDIIDQARKDSVETFGVTGGGKIADYLSEDSEDEVDSTKQSEVALDSLLDEVKSKKVDHSEDVIKEVEVDKSDLLENLTSGKTKVVKEDLSEVEEQQRQQLDKSNQKLDELLKDKK